VAAQPAPAHRPRARRRPAPPRRVSGPARPASAAGAGAAGVRVSARAAAGAVRAPATTGRVAVPPPPELLGALRRLPDSRWLDRLLRGRAWVALIGAALIGIVFMQVTLLELNASIGRAVEHTGTLERQNAELRADVSRLSSEERIQRAAASRGMVMPPPGDVRYVRSRGAERDARRAARAMRPPLDPQVRAQQQAALDQAALAEQQAAAAELAASATPAAPAAPAAPAVTAAPGGTAAAPAPATATPAAGTAD